MLDFLKRHLEFAISLILLSGLACIELIAHAKTWDIPADLLLWLILIFLANITRRLIYPGRHITAVSNRLLHIQKEVREIKAALVPDVWEKVESLTTLFDSDLKKVIGPNVQELLDHLRMTFHDNTFELSNPQLFRSFYIRTLQTYTGASFMATSLPHLSYFWGTEAIDNAISSFIKGGGRMKRIFFLASADELNEDEPRRILFKQLELGVDVYTAVTDQVPDHLQQLFVVDSEGRIAWEVIPVPNTPAIKRVRLHWTQRYSSDEPARSKQKLPKSFQQIFEQLSQLPGVHKFTKTDSILDPQSNAPIGLPTQIETEDQVDFKAFEEFEHDGWESSAIAYGSFFGSLTQQSINYLLVETEVERGMNILDVATGPGYVAAAARRRGASATGVDFSEKMIQIARNTYADTDFQVADACDLPFGPGIFDVVLVNFGVLHFGDPGRAFLEAWRVLKHGGRFAFTVWATPEKALGLKIMFNAIKTHGNHYANLPVGPPFFKFSDTGVSEHELESSGFVKVDTRELPLIWRLDSSEEFFKAFYEATARTRGLLQAQAPAALAKIKDHVRKQCQEYEKSGKLKIPMTAVLVTAQKPE